MRILDAFPGGLVRAIARLCLPACRDESRSKNRVRRRDSSGQRKGAAVRLPPMLAGSSFRTDPSTGALAPQHTVLLGVDRRKRHQRAVAGQSDREDRVVGAVNELHTWQRQRNRHRARKTDLQIVQAA